jgi:hypothetical protein
MSCRIVLMTPYGQSPYFSDIRAQSGTAVITGLRGLLSPGQPGGLKPVMTLRVPLLYTKRNPILRLCRKRMSTGVRHNRHNATARSRIHKALDPLEEKGA